MPLYDVRIFIISTLSFHGFVTNRSARIAKVKGSNPVQAWILSGFYNFLRIILMTTPSKKSFDWCLKKLGTLLKRLLLFDHRSLIKDRTQTAMINIVSSSYSPPWTPFFFLNSKAGALKSRFQENILSINLVSKQMYHRTISFPRNVPSNWWYITRIFQIWSTPVGYEELAGGFEPIRKAKYFLYSGYCDP